MAKKLMADFCEDPDCVMCQDDDAEAAFWDEFFYAEEKTAQTREGKRYTVKLVDEETGEEQVFEGIKLREQKKARFD